MYKTNMKIILISLFLFIEIGAVYAAPNVWHTGWAQGFIVYSLDNEQNHRISIECSKSNENLDHSVSYESNGNSAYSEEQKPSLSFIFDDAFTSTPPDNSVLGHGADDWIEFTKYISKAHKIDVFIDNKKVDTFYPLPKNVKAVASEIAECKPKL